MPASIGVNLRVTGHCRQGGRKYMEDFFSVAYQQTEDERDLEYAFFGIYDGHGGAEAAAFAKERLMETIVRHRNFWSDSDEDVLRAIKMGYIATHYAMWKEQENWPRTASGLPSTAGTTASVAFIRRGKIYIGHVGDSAIVLGYQEPGSAEWKAKPLTRDHKPECANEMSRIQSCGGKVVAKSGVPRVVWNRPRIGHKGPVRRSTPIDEIPFLAVARSLGDLWSYNSELDAFVVSPDPDCSVIPIDTARFRCLIFGTDGLFNMLNPQTAVNVVQQAERHNEESALSGHAKATWINPSKCLVEKALEMWSNTKMRADNTSVVTLMLDPPGPPRAEVLRNRRKNMPDNGLRIVTRYPHMGTERDITAKRDEVESSSSSDTSSKSNECCESGKIEKELIKEPSRESLPFHPAEPSPVNGRIQHKIRSTEKNEPDKTDLGNEIGHGMAPYGFYSRNGVEPKESILDVMASSSTSEVVQEPKPVASEEGIQINEVSSSSSEVFDSGEDTSDGPEPHARRKARFREQPFRKQRGQRTAAAVSRKRRLEDADPPDGPAAKRPHRSAEPEPRHNLRVRKMSVLESVHRRGEEMASMTTYCGNSNNHAATSGNRSNKKSYSENALKSKRSTNSVLVDKNVDDVLSGNCNSNSGSYRGSGKRSRPARPAPRTKRNLRDKVAGKYATEKKTLSKVKKAKLRRGGGRKMRDAARETFRMNKENLTAATPKHRGSARGKVAKDRRLKKPTRGEPAKTRTLRVGYLRKLRNHALPKGQRKS